jgi:peptide/nickel transport system substrate-binding protein
VIFSEYNCTVFGNKKAEGEKEIAMRRLMILLALIVLTGGLLWAGGAKEEPAGTIDSKVGGTLTVATEEPVRSLDILQSIASLPTSTAAQHIFDTLVTKNSEGEILPRLAERWETPDENTWIFYLRQNAVFHNDEPVLATDVVAAATALRDGRYPVSPLWADVVGIEAVDDYTVKFTTKAPVGTFLSTLWLLYIAPSEHYVDGKYDRSAGEKPIIGSGPYKVESFALSDRLVLVANEDYWGGRPNLDRIIFLDIPEVTARVTGVLTGEIDIVIQLPPEQHETIRQADDVQLISSPSWGNYMVWFNVFPENRTEGGPADRNPLADYRVRQAMWYAVDSQELADTIFKGIGVPGRGAISSQVFGYVEQDPYEYNPQKARELLAEAGYPNGFQAALNFHTGFIQARPFSIALTSYWAEVGIDVEPRELERSVWVDELVSGTFDILIASNFIVTGDADYGLGRLYVPCRPEAKTWAEWKEAGGNRLGWCGEGYDEAIDVAKRTTDLDDRLDAYEVATEIIWRDLPSIWPIELLATYAVRDRVHDFEPLPSQMPWFADVWVTEE